MASAARIPSYISTHIVRTKTEAGKKRKLPDFFDNALLICDFIAAAAAAAESFFYDLTQKKVDQFQFKISEYFVCLNLVRLHTIHWHWAVRSEIREVTVGVSSEFEWIFIAFQNRMDRCDSLTTIYSLSNR